MVRDENLDFWIRHGYNVLFIGAHGVGKTSIVQDAFNRNGLTWKYFSAATIDPWVDLVGVPKEQRDENGKPYLDLLRCQGLDEVEAFFFDELNRAHKKVRNAVMELIQFRTINGKPFKKLRAIWAAINPEDDDTYDVEKLDPAQADRFHVKVPVPYKPDKEYFASRYGEGTARAAISWWHDLPEEIKSQVSPRRLDYALDIHSKKGDVRFVLPEASNISKLLTTLKHGPVQDTLQAFLANNDVAGATEFINNENAYQSAIGYVKKKENLMKFFFPLLSAEKLSVLASETSPLKFIMDNISTCDAFANCIRNVYAASTDKGAVREINKAARTSPDVAKLIGSQGAALGVYPLGVNAEKPYWSKKPTSSGAYTVRIKELIQLSSRNAFANTNHRKDWYYEVVSSIPSKLETEQAIDTLKFLNHISDRSHSNTIINHLNHFMGLVNHCFSQIASNTGQSLDGILKLYASKHFHSLRKKILSDKILSSRLVPFGPQRPNTDSQSTSSTGYDRDQL